MRLFFFFSCSFRLYKVVVPIIVDFSMKTQLQVSVKTILQQLSYIVTSRSGKKFRKEPSSRSRIARMFNIVQHFSWSVDSQPDSCYLLFE